MSRTSVLLAALTTEPTSTSELYDRVGYRTLARLGLIPYQAFRAELVRLAAAGSIERQTARDGSTMWRRPPRSGTSDSQSAASDSQSAASD
jgi:hypothetical protein